MMCTGGNFCHLFSNGPFKIHSFFHEAIHAFKRDPTCWLNWRHAVTEALWLWKQNPNSGGGPALWHVACCLGQLQALRGCPAWLRSFSNSSMSSNRAGKLVGFKLCWGACVCHRVSAAAFLSRGLAQWTGRGQGKRVGPTGGSNNL